MERSLIGELKIGQVNRVQGFVENIRNKRTMAFLVLRDYSGRLQLTVEKEKYPVEKLSFDSPVEKPA